MSQHLLAVDLGIKMGLALFNDQGRLCWYRSQNFGSVARLKRGIYPILSDIENLAFVVTEGDRNLAERWHSVAERRGASCRTINAETWRRVLLHPRQQRSGSSAKQNADDIARKIIAWSGASRPTSLRHDAAEAILIGFWGVLEVGWLQESPL